VRLADADTAVLSAVESQLLNVAVLETALFKALAVLDGQREQDGAEPLRQELARLDAEVGRLTAAIAAGGSLESLLAALQDREQRRAHIRAAITEQERQQAAQRDQGDSLAVMREALPDWQGMLHAETGPARTALQALLAGRLVFTPGPEGYTFSGVGTVAPIIAGVVPKGSGARTRTIPPAIRRALHHRDRGAASRGAVSGSARAITSVTGPKEAPPRCRTSPCSVAGTTARSTRRATSLIDSRTARFRFRRPDGRLLLEVPPPPEVPVDPVQVLVARHDAEELHLHARTAMPGWMGERLDVGWAINVLHPLAG
jgi:hypothetical protein